MIANGRVRGALPALGQPKTPATIPHSDRLGKEFRHRSVCGAGQPAGPQVSRCIGFSGDRKFPALTVRSGTQRARRRGRAMTVGGLAAWSSSPPSELRITRVSQCVARGLKAPR